MPLTDDGGYAPHRFQVYQDGKPVGPVWPTNREAWAYASSKRESAPTADLEIVALSNDEDPNSVVIPSSDTPKPEAVQTHWEPSPKTDSDDLPPNVTWAQHQGVKVSSNDPVLPPYYHILVGGTALGLGTNDPYNIFGKERAKSIRNLLIQDLLSDGTMPADEADRLVIVKTIGDE